MRRASTFGCAHPWCPPVRRPFLPLLRTRLHCASVAAARACSSSAALLVSVRRVRSPPALLSGQSPPGNFSYYSLIIRSGTLDCNRRRSENVIAATNAMTEAPIATTSLLVVEDDRKLVRALERGLAREGYAVDVAYTGEDALELVRGRAYDAVVLDVMLPGADGFEVCEALRREQRTPARAHAHRPVRGGRPHPRARRGRRRLPRQAVRLRRAARAAARAEPARPVRAPAPIVEVGELRLDSATRTVTRAGPAGRAHRPRVRGARAPGAPRRAGRVARGRCSSRSGTATKTGRPNVVDVYVGYLRKKLDDASDRAAHPDRPRRGVRAGVGVRLPIRARLTVWYAAVLAVVVVALGAFLVLRLRIGPAGGGRSRRSPGGGQDRAGLRGAGHRASSSRWPRPRCRAAAPRRRCSTPTAACCSPTATGSRRARWSRGRSRRRARGPAGAPHVRLGAGEPALPGHGDARAAARAPPGRRRRRDAGERRAVGGPRPRPAPLRGPGGARRHGARRLVAGAQGAAPGRADDLAGARTSASTGSTSASRSRARRTRSATSP